MAAPPIFIPPFWIALAPEINTSRLMAGGGAAPMLQAAAGWEALAISLETQADELMASLSSLSSLWQGMASERAVTATMPMVLWLRMLSLQALKRGLQATAQATSYTTAMATTPQLAEIELNHVTHSVLEATNFLEINRLPITLTELDYQRMWDLAAAVMDGYQAETLTNSTFEPIAPATPIVIPGVGEMALGQGAAQAAAGAPEAATRDLVFAQVSGQAKAEQVGQTAGRAANMANEGANNGRSEATQSRTADGQQNQLMQQGMQMATQVGSTLGQLPQQLMQGVTQPFQQMTQPLQQVSSIFGQMGGMGGDKGAQVGMIGATPFSNHPAIGGSGASAGAGLVRAASLPGAGGTSSRTPLMSKLVGMPLEPSVSPVSVAAGAAAGATAAGLAPVGGSGAGGPMGMMGHGSKSGGSKPGLLAPSPLAQDLAEDEEDDW